MAVEKVLGKVQFASIKLVEMPATSPQPTAFSHLRPNYEN